MRIFTCGLSNRSIDGRLENSSFVDECDVLACGVGGGLSGHGLSEHGL